MFHNDQAFVWGHCCRITDGAGAAFNSLYFLFRLYAYILSVIIAFFSFISLSLKQYSDRFFQHDFVFVSVHFCIGFFQYICAFLSRRDNYFQFTVVIAFLYRVPNCPSHTTRLISILLRFCFDWEDIYIKHSKQCFIGYRNTSNFVKNTLLLVVFSTGSLLSVWISRWRCGKLDHLTVACAVTWSLNDSDVADDLVVIKISLLLLFKSSCSYAN